MFRSRVMKFFMILTLIGTIVSCAQPTAAPVPTQPPPPPPTAVPAPTEAPTAAPAATEAPTTAPTVAPAPTQAAAAAPLSIGFAYVGPVSDGGWTMTHDVARKAVEAAFPGQVKTAFVENMPYSDEASRTLEQFISDGAKVIIINSEYADFVTNVANKHPDVVFLECDGHRIADNEIWYYVAHWDPAYLIGMAAGLMTKTNKLGYIGSYPVQSVYSDVNAFEMGALSVNPKATTQVVLINSWFDPAKANQAAGALIDNGADFVLDIMDETAALQVEEKRGVWASTWNTDQRRAAPTKYVSSISVNWNDFYVSEVKAVLNGTWKGNRSVILPLGKGVDRDAWGPNVPTAVQQQVDAVRDKMLNGSFTPFVGPIKDSKGNVKVAAGTTMTEDQLYLWDWSVQGVSGLPN